MQTPRLVLMCVLGGFAMMCCVLPLLGHTGRPFLLHSARVWGCRLRFPWSKHLFTSAQSPLFRSLKQSVSPSALGLCDTFVLMSSHQKAEGTANYPLSWVPLVHSWVHQKHHSLNSVNLPTRVWDAERATCTTAYKRLLPLSTVKCLRITYELLFWGGGGGQKGKAVGGGG